MKSLPLLLLPPLLLLSLASCGLATGADAPRTERAQTRLMRALDGKVAGEPQKCLSLVQRNDLEIVDRNTILFKNGRDIVYRNDPAGGCGGLDPSRIIVTESFGSDLCRGDIVRVVDRTSGAFAGSCALADFVPYRVPGSARATR